MEETHGDLMSTHRHWQKMPIRDRQTRSGMRTSLTVIQEVTALEKTMANGRFLILKNCHADDVALANYILSRSGLATFLNPS